MNFRSGVLFLFLSILTITSSGFSQLNQPESIVYDSLNERYLVSNWGNGNLVQIDSEGERTVLFSGMHCHAGLVIRDNILYVACREYGVKAFDLETDENILTMGIPGTTNLNDIVVDNSGNIFLSYPTGNQIIRVDFAEETWNVFVDEGLNTPNGMYFDEENNRLVVISYRFNSPIQAVDLADSSLSTITTTTLDNLDGLTRDGEGNYYASSWHTNSIYRFNSDFTSEPEQVVQFNDDPADISYTSEFNELAVPLFFTHNVQFVSLDEDAVDYQAKDVPSNFKVSRNYPEPFNASTSIPFYLPVDSDVKMTVYDILGNLVFESGYSGLNPGKHRLSFSGVGLASGTYFAKLSSGKSIQVLRIHLVK